MTSESGASDLRALEARLRAVEDRLAVQELMARYHDTCDGWDEFGTHRDPEAIAALFTEDGVWDVTARDPAPRGRAEIAALARDLQSVPWIVHTAVNPIVQVDGDVAAGEFKGILRVRAVPDARLAWTLGRYRLEARRADGEWRIASLHWQPITRRERFDPTA